MIKRILVLLLCAVFIISIPFDVAFGAQKFTAELTEMKGTVEVIRGGGEKSFKAFVKMKLSEGDKIITGPKSSAKIQIDKDLVITLAENTRINISELKGSKGSKQSSVDLQAGGVGASVKQKIKSNSRFEIKTPTAVMGVRGTDFFVQYLNGITDTRVLSGIVRILNEEWPEFLEIHGLEQVQFGEGDPLDEAQASVEPLELEGLGPEFLDHLKRMEEESPGTVPAGLMGQMEGAMAQAAQKSDENAARTDLAPDDTPGGQTGPIVGTINQGAPGTTGPPAPAPSPPTRPARPTTPTDPGQGEPGQGEPGDPEPVEPVVISYEVVDIEAEGGTHNVSALQVTMTAEGEIYFRAYLIIEGEVTPFAFEDPEEYSRYEGSFTVNIPDYYEEEFSIIIEAFAKKEEHQSELTTEEVKFNVEGSFEIYHVNDNEVETLILENKLTMNSFNSNENEIVLRVNNENEEPLSANIYIEENDDFEELKGADAEIEPQGLIVIDLDDVSTELTEIYVKIKLGYYGEFRMITIEFLEM